MLSCSRDDPSLSRESFEALAREGARKAKAEALRTGKKDGRRWAKRQATGQELRRLEKLRDWCNRKAKGWWEDSFEHLYRTEGPKAVSDHLACAILGVQLDEDIGQEFWEDVFTNGNPYLNGPAEFNRGFAE